MLGLKKWPWAKLATEISEAIFSKCLQVSRRIRRISSTKFASMTDQPDMRRPWLWTPNSSVSQKTARWYAWSASTKVETMLQSFFKVEVSICAPLIKFVLKFSVFQLYYQGTVLQHKNPTNGKPQLPMVLHTPVCIYSFASRGKPKTQKLKPCQSIQLSRAYS